MDRLGEWLVGLARQEGRARDLGKVPGSSHVYAASESPSEVVRLAFGVSAHR